MIAMHPTKRRRLRAAGWRVGTAEEFLGLTPEEAAFVEVKLALSAGVKRERARRRITQTALARLLRSSQSRIAKVEAADPSVSLDLLVRALLALGVTPRDLGRMIASAGRGLAA
jgi:5-carboxymethyl-2-hydroxymuconate isomerase